MSPSVKKKTQYEHNSEKGGGAAASLICVLFLRISPTLQLTTVYDLGEDTFSTMLCGQAQYACAEDWV